jgi:hypothetical protein
MSGPFRNSKAVGAVFGLIPSNTLQVSMRQNNRTDSHRRDSAAGVSVWVRGAEMGFSCSLVSEHAEFLNLNRVGFLQRSAFFFFGHSQDCFLLTCHE